jgi:Tol biopolymer transport system component
VLALGTDNLENPTFAPDGRHIVFTDQITLHSSRLAIVRANGSDVHPIPNTERLQAFGDSWSPNGRWIAFANNQFGAASSIFIIHPNGHGLRRVTRPGKNAFNDVFPVWSPEGNQIAFDRSPCPNSTNGCPFSDVAIWVIGANESHPHAITHNPTNNYLFPDWGRRP